MIYKTLTAAGLLACAGTVAAAQKGDNVFQVGWFHLETLEKDHELSTKFTQTPVTEAAGLPETLVSPGTGASVNSADTLAFIYTHFFTDHWALEFAAGLPPTFDIKGKGTLEAGPYALDLGDDAFTPLAKADQYSPALIVQYHFRTPDKKLRPYVGLGVSYVWYDNIKLSKNFEQTIDSTLGPTLALGVGESSSYTKADADSNWSAVLNAGMSYTLNQHWNLTASASYLPLSTTAHINVRSDDGVLLAQSNADIDINPLVLGLFVGYRF